MATEPLAVHEYDSSWPDRYAEIASRVRGALGVLALRVEHVGSTAVPGLAAKPIIDLDVVVKSTAEVEEAIHRLAPLGYVHEGDLGITGRQAFRSPPAGFAHHLYLLAEEAAELRRHLTFRDQLRADPRLRDEYAKLKRSLAARTQNRNEYSEGKANFVRAVLGNSMRLGGDP